MASFVSYEHLSPASSCLISSLDYVVIPKIVKKALNHPGWHNAMLEEIHVLDKNHTRDLTDLPKGKKK